MEWSGCLFQGLRPSIKGLDAYQGTFSFPHSSFLRAPLTAFSLCPFRPGGGVSSHCCKP